VSRSDLSESRARCRNQPGPEGVSQDFAEFSYSIVRVLMRRPMIARDTSEETVLHRR
jgi:hypothetical protein